MVNIGIIGVGYWGINLVRNYSQCKGAKVHSVCDSNVERKNYIEENYGNDIRFTLDYKNLLKHHDIDAVIISTPAMTHYKIAKDCLLSDKHVFVEKPLAMNVMECKELIDISEEREKVLMVGHTFLYNTAVNKLKEYMDGNELGQIYYIYSQRLNLGIVRQDINAMWNFAPHDISIILYLMGMDPVSVSASGLSYLQKNIQDVVFLNLGFSNKVSSHIHVSWIDSNKVRKMTIVGAKKMAVYDDTEPVAKIKIYEHKKPKENTPKSFDEFKDFGKFQLVRRAGDLFIPRIKYVEPLKIECSHFIECITKKIKPLSDGLNGLQVVKVLEAAQRSLDNGGMSIDL